MPRKPNRKTKHYSLPELLKSASKDNLHPEFGLKKTAMRIRLEASQIAGLRKLARRNGTMGYRGTRQRDRRLSPWHHARRDPVVECAYRPTQRIHGPSQ